MKSKPEKRVKPKTIAENGHPTGRISTKKVPNVVKTCLARHKKMRNQRHYNLTTQHFLQISNHSSQHYNLLVQKSLVEVGLVGFLFFYQENEMNERLEIARQPNQSTIRIVEVGKSPRQASQKGPPGKI